MYNAQLIWPWSRKNMSYILLQNYIFIVNSCKQVNICGSSDVYDGIMDCNIHDDLVMAALRVLQENREPLGRMDDTSIF